jgi:hypothetical protein
MVEVVNGKDHQAVAAASIDSLGEFANHSLRRRACQLPAYASNLLGLNKPWKLEEPAGRVLPEGSYHGFGVRGRQELAKSVQDRRKRLTFTSVVGDLSECRAYTGPRFQAAQEGPQKRGFSNSGFTRNKDDLALAAGRLPQKPAQIRNFIGSAYEVFGSITS